MHLQKITSRFLHYNLWANQRIISLLKSLDQSILYEKTGSSFRTIDLTLQHILSAQNYWYAMVVGAKLIEFNQAVRKSAIEEVMADLLKSSKAFIDDLAMLTEAQWAESIQVADSRQSRYEYILHLVNHGSYHRGQVITMVRTLGMTGEIPPTDYDAYLWWIENMAAN